MALEDSANGHADNRIPGSLSIERGTDYETVTTIKRSRFIAVLRRVDTEASARHFIAECVHRWPDARHHCSALRIATGVTHPIERRNDDSEPAGTAGAPMLGVLRSWQVVDICAVVVRYFGGVKLGTGGLTRAYSEAVTSALERASFIRKEAGELVSFHLSLAEVGRVAAGLHQLGITIENIDYGEQVTIWCAVSREQFVGFHSVINSLTQREVDLPVVGSITRDVAASPIHSTG